MKHSFLVQALGFWGRGKTLKEAAAECHKAGAKNTTFVVVDLVLGDEKPEVSNGGMSMLLEEGAEIIRIGKFFKLGQLQLLEGE